VSRLRVTTRGTTSTKVVEVSPPESRTVRWIRYQTLVAVSPVSGIVNEPPVLPLVAGKKGWKCVS
jgi:hypothetical protein